MPRASLVLVDAALASVSSRGVDSTGMRRGLRHDRQA
jgi:hypothetical protein